MLNRWYLIAIALALASTTAYAQHSDFPTRPTSPSWATLSAGNLTIDTSGIISVGPTSATGIVLGKGAGPQLRIAASPSCVYTGPMGSTGVSVATAGGGCLFTSDATGSGIAYNGNALYCNGTKCYSAVGFAIPDGTAAAPALAFASEAGNGWYRGAAGQMWWTTDAGSNAAIFGYNGSGSLRLTKGLQSLYIETGGATLQMFNGAVFLGGSLFVPNSTDTGVRPTCDSTKRNAAWVADGASGATDTFQVCLKSAANTYSWVNIVTGG